MRQQYLPPNYNATLLINLEKLKHTDTVEKYVHDFLYIANQLHDVSDFVKVHIFTSNLQHEIGTEVRYKKPTNLTKAIRIASDYENFKKINQSTEINFIKQRSHESNMNKQKTCYYCKKHAHIKTECRKFKRDQQEQAHFNSTNRFKNNTHHRKFINSQHHFKNTTKHHSNNYNHRSYNPRNNTNRNTYNASNQAYAIDTHIAGDDDDIEQQIHMIQTSKTSLPTATALIYGSQTQVIFDTGASQSVIALNFVEKYKIPYQISNEKCKLGNNVTIPIIGITQSVEVIVYGTICKLKFLILPRNNVLPYVPKNKNFLR